MLTLWACLLALWAGAQSADSLCYVRLVVDSTSGKFVVTAVGSGQGPYVYEWDNGDSGPTIEVTPPATVCVALTDASGCRSRNCLALGEVNPPPPPGCGIYIRLIFDEGQRLFQAVGSGSGALSYRWSTGAVTTDITPTVPGEYCVTVTDEKDCQAFTCVYFRPDTIPPHDSLCLARIYLDTLGTDTFLVARGNGAPPYSYFWSSGETTERIRPGVAVEYCVTVVDARDCDATACFNLPKPPPPGQRLNGYIFLSDSIPDARIQGLVYLYELTPNGAVELVDSTEFANDAPYIFSAYYDFNHVPDGVYLLRAALSPASNVYDQFVPTYHSSTWAWTEATQVSVPYWTDGLFNIVLLPVQAAGAGPGSISGVVEHLNKSSGAAGHTVLLLDAGGVLVGVAQTDASGRFGFTGLPFGTYRVHVETAGLHGDDYSVTLHEGQPSTGSLVFTILPNENRITTRLREPWVVEAALVSPNPVRDLLSLDLNLRERAALMVELRSVQGHLLRQERHDLPAGASRLSWNWTDLPPGVYLLSLRRPDGVLTQRIIKQ